MVAGTERLHDGRLCASVRAAEWQLSDRLPGDICNFGEFRISLAGVLESGWYIFRTGTLIHLFP